MVEEFIKNKQLNSIEENNNQNNNKNDNIDENNNKIDENNKNNNEEQKIQKNNFKTTDEISSQIQSISIIGSTKNINISISSYSKIEAKNILSKSYITYNITSLPFNYTVNRRYSDFEWLRQILSSIYSGNLIPSIPKKKISDRFNETFILKRMRTLEKFLNFLITDPIIRNNEILEEFLKNENFIDIKKKYEKVKIPLKLNEYYSLQGKIDLSINKEREDKLKEIKEDINNNESLYKKLTMSIKQLNNEMNNVNIRINEISNIFDNLYSISEKYNYCSTIINAFKNSSHFFKNIYETNKKNIEIINVNFREYFKYIKNIYRGLKENINTLETAKNNFYTNESKLNSKKESLFQKGDTSKWGLDSKDKIDMNSLLNNKKLAFEKMLPKENKNVYSLKKTYGYYLNKGLTEFERIRNILSLKNIDIVFEYGNKFKLNIDELSEQYKEILNELMNEKIKNNELEENKRSDVYYPIVLEPFAKEFKPEKEDEEKKDSNNNEEKKLE
jgi:sorting nexin-7/30/sorting nexin-8